ncbi:MotA/TolQ/ExbB proton channel family protein [Lentisphaera marina]|uniref:MotA/TolQ/ExbB proton channel family protein n=1 Tax=Lentisphaera marina TaxID=1111041 RepID=UPI0023654552|nr:MotA/TolQ/ExbB proton channel family protein [Lentisphaera marina]MDD7986103.1 MotA/TolQ/ExbB proton channel family protein [Lentisphaera marina]
MKKVILVLVLFLCNTYAVDLQKASEQLQSKYLEANKTLSSLQEDIFSQRQTLLSDIDAAKNELNALAVQSLDEEIKALQDELSNSILAIEELENETELFQDGLLENRRQFESLLSQGEIEEVEEALQSWDQSLEKKSFQEALVQSLELSQSIMSKGFEIHLSKAKVADDKGLIKEAEVLAIGRAKNYYRLDQLSGIGTHKSDSIYPQITAIESSKHAFDDFAQNGTCSLNLDFSNGLVFKDSAKKKTIQDHLKAGGIMVYPLLLLGAICILIALYKFVQLFSIRSQYDDKVIKLIILLKEGKKEEAEAYVSTLKKPIRALLSEALKYKDAPREDLEELLNETILSELPRLDRLMHILSVSAGAAPLMGLLGTVMGIIKTFEMIGIYGTADTNQLSLGISEALVTTEVGLIVAIPTLITYSLLNRRLRSIVSNLEKASLSFINGLRA